MCHSRVFCDQVAREKTHKHVPTEKLVTYVQLLVMLHIPACYKLIVS